MVLHLHLHLHLPGELAQSQNTHIFLAYEACQFLMLTEWEFLSVDVAELREGSKRAVWLQREQRKGHRLPAMMMWPLALA